MASRVIKPFPYAEDGHTVVGLNIGDEREFGDATAGLTDEGFIEPAGEVADEPSAAELDADPAPKAEPSADAVADAPDGDKPSKRK